MSVSTLNLSENKPVFFAIHTKSFAGIVKALIHLLIVVLLFVMIVRLIRAVDA